MSKSEKFSNAAAYLESIYEELDITREDIAITARIENNIDIRGLYTDIIFEVEKVKRRIIDYIHICEEWSER